MRILTNLLFRVALPSMILTAPTAVTEANKDVRYGVPAKEVVQPYYSSEVIKKFVKYTPPVTSPVYKEDKEAENMTPAIMMKLEQKIVINEAIALYSGMDLQQAGLDEKAFEYAWRGYHNLIKRGLVRKRNVLSICDFSQPSCNKRMYVIDLDHKKILYRTYVAHGQNSGEEYATSFSNEPESFKSSLGFYITNKAYYGRNGLSLRILGVDTGFNDLARKRHIVLHGSSYVSLKYMSNFGSLGTSLGCPAIPLMMSPRIIRVVKNGSCLFIYHPTKKYLEESAVING